MQKDIWTCKRSETVGHYGPDGGQEGEKAGQGGGVRPRLEWVRVKGVEGLGIHYSWNQQ